MYFIMQNSRSLKEAFDFFSANFFKLRFNLLQYFYSDVKKRPLVYFESRNIDSPFLTS